MGILYLDIFSLVARNFAQLFFFVVHFVCTSCRKKSGTYGSDFFFGNRRKIKHKKVARDETFKQHKLLLSQVSKIEMEFFEHKICGVNL